MPVSRRSMPEHRNARVAAGVNKRSDPPMPAPFSSRAFPANARLLVLRAIVIACVALPSAIGRAADVNVVVRRTADAVVIEANALINADAGTAWRVLTDYD